MSTNILHSCLSWKQTLTTINFRVSFQGCLHSKWSQKIKIFLLSEQRVGLLTALDNKGNVSLGSKDEACVLLNVKDSGSRSSGFFSCNTATACAGIHLGPSASLPWDSGARTMDTSLLMLMLIAVLGVIKVFVPGLRVSRLLPASAKLAGQTH